MSKLFEATVVSAKMPKTIVVQVDSKFRHPRFGKVITKHKKFKVHCEDATVKPGDYILIAETRPISRDKHFTLVKKLKSGRVAQVTRLADENLPEKEQRKKTEKPDESKLALETETKTKTAAKASPKKRTVKSVKKTAK